MNAPLHRSLWAPERYPFTPGTITRAIIQEVADHHEMTVNELLATNKGRRFAHARQEAMAVLRERTNLSLSQIAVRLRLTDHTTVLYGIRQHQKRQREKS